jgi:hypothetical protein
MEKHAGGWLVNFFLSLQLQKAEQKGLNRPPSSLSVDAWMHSSFLYH